jgi:two-component system, sensor histidine kinase and response regulator
VSGEGDREREIGRLRSILDASDDAIVTTDLEGRVIDWNDRASEVFGWDADEVRGRTVFSFLVPDAAREVFLEGLERHGQPGESSFLDTHREATALTEDGREIAVEISTSIVAFDDTVVCALFLRDLTDRKTEERRLAQRMLEARLLQESSSPGSSVDDVRGLLRTCIEVTCEVAGWAGGAAFTVDGGKLIGSTEVFRDDVEIGANLGAWLVERLVERPVGILERVLRRGRPVSIEDAREDPFLADFPDWETTDLRHVAGLPVLVERRVEVVLLLFAPPQGLPTRESTILTRNMVAQLSRVFERRRRDEERSRLAAIVDGSYDAIIGRGPDGRIISWNQGAERTYGYTAAEAIGRSIALLLPEGVTDEEEEIRDAIRSGGRLSQFEAWRRHADGRALLLSITISTIKDSRGRVIGSSSIGRDVTLRRKREFELQEAVTAAERANKTKSEFLANISHELRTPMNAILGMLDLSLGEPLDDELRDYLETARDSANTLLYLLNDLLDFSRMEAGRFELDDEPFRLRDTLDAVAKTLSLRAYEKGLELACRVDPDVPDHLRGDGRRLRQILMNLVGNAIKFTTQGEVVVDARVETRDAKRVVLQIDVRDTGIGIPEDQQQRIFDAFAQADASSTRQYQGTGLGLAITRELVDKKGGSIGVVSRSGEGSTFTCLIPYVVLGDEIPQRRDQESLVRELKDLPVLVVDDNATNRLILSEMLSNWRMHPVAVESAAQALEALRAARADRHPFPLVVVDALMPEVDGFELVHRIRREELTARGTILMLSSADRHAFREQAEDLDVDAFLEKPVSQSAMLDVIMTTLRGPQLEQSTVRALRPARGSLRILIAEDTPANQKVVRSILAKRGHTASVAHNGREALEMHQLEEFDAVLMDVQMPTMDGLQATRAIRALDDHDKSSIPIVAMTAHAMQGDRERCIAAGMDAYVSKPIDARRLVRLVEELVEPHTAEAATAAERDAATVSGRPTPVVPPGNGVAVPVFVPAVALQRLGDDEELLRDLVQFYGDDSRVLMETIRSQLALREAPAEGEEAEIDGDELMRAAHSLKGLSANLEAIPVRDAAGRIERAARAGHFAEARDHLPALEHEIERLWRALEEH